MKLLYLGINPCRQVYFEIIHIIEKLKIIIGKKETLKRKSAFEKAERFICGASENGGLSVCVKQSFKVKGTKDVRVDIEVLSGIAFV